MSSPYMTGILSLILLVSAVFDATTLNVPNSGSVAVSTRWFDYVVVIMLENHSINYTYYNGRGINPCLGNCTYFTSLANNNGLAMNYTNDAIASPSAGDYIAITSGYGNTQQQCNAGPRTSGCNSLQLSNIVDSLENAGLGWKVYMEGYPMASGCAYSPLGAPFYYDPVHNPFVYYSDIQNNPARCAHIVNANSQTVNQSSDGCWPTALPIDDLFLRDLNNVTRASNYMWLTPNRIDDLHNCNDVSTGNAWLQEMIPKILGSTLFSTRRAALFVTFDEPACTNPPGQPICPPALPQLYSVWASNPSAHVTISGHKSNQVYTHYSALRTIEDNWNLPQFYTSTDGSAANMNEFFLAA